MTAATTVNAMQARPGLPEKVINANRKKISRLQIICLRVDRVRTYMDDAL